MSIEEVVACERGDCGEHEGRCEAKPESESGAPIFYLSREDAVEDLGPWDWHVDGEHVCCSECADRCWFCESVHGKHTERCDRAFEE